MSETKVICKRVRWHLEGCADCPHAVPHILRDPPEYNCADLISEEKLSRSLNTQFFRNYGTNFVLVSTYHDPGYPEQVRLIFSCFGTTAEFDYWTHDCVESRELFLSETEKILTVLRELLQAVEEQESYEVRMFFDSLECRTTSYIACFFDARSKNLFLDISDGDRIFKMWGIAGPELVECVQGMEEVVDNFRMNVDLLYQLHKGGKSRSAALAFVQKMEARGEITPETANLAMVMIGDAFEDPVEPDIASKAWAIQEFQNRWGIICEALDCLKGPKKKGERNGNREQVPGTDRRNETGA